jgi:membrane associated rhomboid family serine protease
MSKLGWLQKMPIMSLLFVAAIAAVSFKLAHDPAETTARFEVAQESARAFLTRNPRLQVDSLGELILDPDWLVEMRAVAANADTEFDVELPPRMVARSQARLDGLIGAAYEARMSADPAWRLGVLDGNSPRRNYVAHAFVHEAMAGVALSLVVLLLVGIPLERTWGSPIYAAFVIGAIPAVAHAYRALDASSGIPWSGTAGLAGALLGAYFIRGLGGYFVVPGWVALPAWLGVEAIVVRGFWLDDLGSVPWATFCAAIGLGAFVAGGLRLMNIESRFDEMAAKSKQRGPNPIVARAARMRSDGDPYQAFDLIQAAWRDEPKDKEVCEAFFSIAVEVGQPEAAAEAILPSLHQALKEGDVERAIEYWFPLAAKECEVSLEPTASVRLGEGLLDAGHPEQALFSLRQALDSGVSSAHATRIANIARDLDPGLTRQAAAIALTDAGLDSKIRADLESLVTVLSPDPPETSAPDELEPSRSQLDRRVQAEHQTVEVTAFPLDLDSDIDDDLDLDLKGDLAEVLSNEAALVDQALDAGALSAESLEADAENSAPSLESTTIPEDSGDVLSHWTEQAVDTTDTLTDVSAALDAEVIAEALFEPDDLETPEMGFDFGLRAAGADEVDPRDDETDTDFTPLMDANDDHTRLMGRDASSEFLVSRPNAGVEAGQDFAFGGEEDQATSIMQLRSLKAIEAVPLEATAEWIEIDADGRGKSKLPYSRIQAISMVAVSGLGPRPVLVLDLVLNWVADSEEPMKLIRLRSDRFDPLDYAPQAGGPLAALTAWVVALENQSGATCLPTQSLLEGQFTRHASLEAYERAVLMASRDV